MRSALTSWLTAAALLVLLPPAAEAQNGHHTLLPGDTVRVAAPTLHEGMIEGELLLYRGDSIAVREASTGTEYQFPLATVRRLEKNQGMDRRRSVRRWAVAGLFLGAAAGLVSGPLIATGTDDQGGIVGPTLLAGLGGGLVGLGVGAASGSVFARDHWQRFRTPVSRAAPAVQVGVRIPVP